MANDQEVLASVERTEALIQELEQTADPGTCRRLREIVEGLMQFHGAAAARLLEIVAARYGLDVVQALAADDLVGSLLVLYGLHPDDLERRVERALSEVRPQLQSHGGDVRLVDVNDDVVRLQMEGSCHGCPSSAQTMKSTIEQAILAAAPDAAAIEVDGLTPTTAVSTPNGFVPIAALAMKGAS